MTPAFTLQFLLFTPAHIAYYLSLVAILALTYWQPAIVATTRNAILRSSTRGFFSSPNEAPKFALLRIVLGVILLWRAYDEWILLTPTDMMRPEIYVMSMTNLFTGLLLLLGLGTQWTILFLLLVQWHAGDLLRSTRTLGNDVASILCVLLFLVQSGRHLSVDAWLIRRGKIFRQWLLYTATPSSAETITIAKCLCLLSYWLVCLYSLSMHLNEPAWMSGTGGPLLLSNNFMSRYFVEFTHYFTNYEWSVYLARVSLWLMLPWYLLVFPAILFGGVVRTYAIVWGILFFSLSKFILQLGWLAEIEFVMWAGLFWSRRGIAQPGRLAIAFDDTCNLCDRTVQFVRRVDLFERTQLKPASKNIDWLAQYGVSYERAMEDLYGIDTTTGKSVAGYRFYVRLSQELVVLWPLYPLLLVGQWLGIGPTIYRWVAQRRRKLFGFCKVPVPKRAPIVYPMATDPLQSRISSAVVLHILLLGIFYLLAVPAPYLGVKGWHTPMADAAHLHGITPIDVFNANDLALAENWFTLHFIEKTGREILVPLLTKEGARLSFHRSDRVYFGNTLRFRRLTIHKVGCQYKPTANFVDYLATVYLAQQKMAPGEYRFMYRQYHQPLPDAGLLRQNQFRLLPYGPRCEILLRIRYPQTKNGILSD